MPSAQPTVNRPPPLPATLVLRLTRNASRVRIARLVARAWFRHTCRMSDDRTETVVLILSELVTNAIAHGRGHDIALHATMSVDGAVCLEVNDFTFSDAPQPLSVGPEAENGRGLWLVRRSVESLGGEYGHSADGTVAWVRVPLQERPPV
ncbi:ATP-binding protein [Streptomyces sp. NPDC001815]|uniref:ATP-binding protein n=1 Tax=Streptomyces sp. NPDC001815 TaxID=3154526 RepID=UPI00331849EA